MPICDSPLPVSPCLFEALSLALLGLGLGVGETNFSQLCPHKCGLEDRSLGWGGWCECHRVMTLILATDSPDGANSHSAPLRGLAGAVPLTLACSRLTALYFLSVSSGSWS